MNQLAIRPAVAQAIGELEQEFTVSWRATNDGGAIVMAHEVDIGPRWQPQTIVIEFVVPYNYPFPQIYPFYTTTGLARADGAALPSGLAEVAWAGRNVTQISLRPNRWDPSYDTALGALEQVRHWLREGS